MIIQTLQEAVQNANERIRAAMSRNSSDDHTVVPSFEQSTRRNDDSTVELTGTPQDHVHLLMIQLYLHYMTMNIAIDKV